MTTRGNNMKWWLRLLVGVSRLLVAGTFIVSGFAKLNDPLGMTYKLQAYVAALKLGQYVVPEILTLAGMGLGLLEFCFGVYLLFGIRRNLTTRSIIGFMLVMTPITLWVAIANPVPDCGCFGDMQPMDGLQSLSKNIVLLVMALVLFWKRACMVRLISEGSQWVVSMFTIVYGVLLATYALFKLPPVDFRPYHVGASIADIDGFAAWDIDTDDDYTDSLVADTSYVLMVVMPRVETASASQTHRINLLHDYATRQGVMLVGLTGTLDGNAIELWRDMNGAEYPLYGSDETELKTMVRSSPGLLVLHQGRIMAKWSNIDIPLVEMGCDTPIDRQPWAQDQAESRTSELLRLLMFYLLPLGVITSLDRLWAAFRWMLKMLRSHHQFVRNLLRRK